MEPPFDSSSAPKDTARAPSSIGQRQWDELNDAEVLKRLSGIAGQPAVAVEDISAAGGYSPARRCVATLADGSTVFVKERQRFKGGWCVPRRARQECSSPPIHVGMATVTGVDLGGPVDEEVAPVAVSDSERRVVATLMRPGWRPGDDQVTQAYGICFTGDGIVLAAWDTGRWNLPGGTIEHGETPEEALVREVAEEACATVTDFEYLASQHVWDPEHPTGPTSYYQSRWWARVRLEEWDPQHEMIDRCTVTPEEFLDVLFWREKAIAARLLDLALHVERSR